LTVKKQLIIINNKIGFFFIFSLLHMAYYFSILPGVKRD
jgi:hypothetical protein